VPRLDTDDFLVADDKVESAAGPAVRAGCGYIFEFHPFTSDNETVFGALFKRDEKKVKFDGF